MLFDPTSDAACNYAAGTGNNAPVLTPIPDQMVTEMAMLSVPLMATDPNADTLTLTATKLPAFCALTDNGGGMGTINCNPGAGTAGTFTVTVTVTDNGAGNLSNQDVFDIVVIGMGNQPPVLAPIGPQTVMVGNTLNIPLSAMDPDGNTVVLSQMNVPDFCVFNDTGGGMGSINCTPMMGNDGTAMITVTATDNGAPTMQDNETFMLTVTPAGGGTITQCSTPSLAIPDGSPATPAVNTLAIADPRGIGDLNVSLTAPHTWVGDLTVTLRHIDTGTAVVLLNQPGGGNCSEDNVDAQFDDESATPAQAQCSAAPPAIGGTVSPANPLSAFDGQSAGGTWELSVVDNAAQDTGTLQTWCVTITPGVAGNNPPTLTPIADQTVAEMGMLSVPLIATDPAMNALAFSTTNLPAFCTLTDNGGGTGSIDCRPGAATANTYPVTVTVTDNGVPIMTAMDTFNIVVTPVGGGTVITQCSTPGLAIPDGSPATPAVNTLAIADPRGIGDLNVSVTAPHTWVGDLTVTLRHIDTGTAVVLLNQPAGGNCSEDNVDAQFDDESATPAQAQCSAAPPAIGGPVSPANPLSAFDGQSAGGTWELSVADNVAQDTGTLQTWCVTITPAAAGNNSPTLTPIANQTVAEMGMLSVPLMATDPAMNALVFSTTNLPAFCTLTDNGGGTGSIDCMPGAATANTYPVTVTVTSNGVPIMTAMDTFDIVVTPVGGATLITQCSTPGLAIPDGSPATPAVNTLAIADPRGIGDLNVSLTAPHTWVGDLTVTLRHIDTGTAVVVLDRPGEPTPTLGTNGCSNDNIDVILDDEGATPAEDACATTPPAIGGTLTPNNPLSAFDGQSAGGTWELSVADSVAQDTGTLQTWCVTITPAAAGNNPPVVMPIGPQATMAGKILVIPVTDPDSGDNEYVLILPALMHQA